jgi:hypothetical protein
MYIKLGLNTTYPVREHTNISNKIGSVILGLVLLQKDIRVSN